MSTDVPARTCRGCGQPTAGKPWHSDCLSAYRASHDYRRETIARDGYACARCPRWWNALVLANRATGRLRPVFAVLAWVAALSHLRRPLGKRRVVADHIDPIGGTGTHDPRNLQVLCDEWPWRHNARKTRVDLARMRGQRLRAGGSFLGRQWARVAIVGVLLVGWARLDTSVAWRLAQADPGAAASYLGVRVGIPLAVAVVLVVGLVVMARWRKRTITRLHETIATVTGASATARRPITRIRWGRVGKRVVPVRFRVRYPHTFQVSNADLREKVEDEIKAKMGFTTAAFTWRADRDVVDVVAPDPFTAGAPERWPWMDGSVRSLWDPIPVGRDRRGELVTLSVVERNVLTGAEPGGGKSNFQSMLTAAAALDPSAELWLIDGKRLLEVRDWVPVAERAESEPKEALAMLRELKEIMDFRYDMLGLDEVRKIEPGDGLGFIVLVIDELASFTSGGFAKKTEEAEFIDLLRDIVSRGRAAGVIAELCTQRPSADVVPTKIRDIVGLRMALRCTTPTSSDMVLGAGWASQGANAARIDPSLRGVGWLLAEGGKPQEVKTFHVDNADLATLARQARAIRAGLVARVQAEAEGVTAEG